jgi:hypothetical protein
MVGTCLYRCQKGVVAHWWGEPCWITLINVMIV